LSTHIDWVEALEEFHSVFGLGSFSLPRTPSNRLALLRIKLMSSELAELTEAIVDKDLVEVADGIVDLLYVVIGTGLSYGIPMKKVFDQVHANNMTKVGRGGCVIRDTSGKVQKPEGYKPVDLSWILDM